LDMKTFEEFKRELLSDPEAKAEYDRLKPEYDLIRQMLKKRREMGLTQADMAKKLKTKQASISRLESADNKASLGRYIKYAEALGSKLKITLD
jgi:predicted transcriptional regulator